MGNNTLPYLIVMLVAIVGLIGYIEYTKPVIETGIVSDADIEIEELFAEEAEVNSSDETVMEEVVVLSDVDRERISTKAEMYDRAKELVGPEGYINVDSITLSEYIGKKVIMIDFWTYSCINCQRTLPYLTKWYEKYKDDDFVIIGVHTPEFEFEKDYDNLLMAVEKWGIEYPVVQDNDRETWRAYQNRYWPRKYLIDIDGFIVFNHIGEGAYIRTEQEIQKAIKEKNEVLEIRSEVASDIIAEKDYKDYVEKTPEIYFGYHFAKDQLGNSEGWVEDSVVSYTYPSVRVRDMFYLDGSWKNNKDDMELVSDDGSIYLEYLGREVNIVAGSSSPQSISVYLDGELHKEVLVSEFDLYNLVSLNESGEHVLEIKGGKGLMAYTFTFG